MTLSLEGVTKRFGDFTAVNDLSFSVPEGRVFGFLGANGAGKTTTIRMILRILLPDTGRVTWRGQAVTDDETHKFGYLPEERGLYPKMKVADQITYLAGLHGGRTPTAAELGDWLERLEISQYKNHRVEQLSKGNQQKVQFAAAVAHRPELVILDEPFSGLDPVNAEVLQANLRYLQEQGTTIIFSSHRLDQVERLCTDVALIHSARLVVAGSLKEIKRQYGRNTIKLGIEGALDFIDRFAGVTVVKETPEYVEMSVPSTVDPQDILRMAVDAGRVYRFEMAEPSLEEIYIKSVRGETK